MKPQETKQKSILLIDDDPDNFDVIEVALINQGYQLYYAVNAYHAWQQLERAPIDVILLDIMMPDQDGISLCRELKNHPQWQQIPILIVTALSGKLDLAQSLQAGADDFLSKPFNHLELQARLRSLVRIKEQQDQLRALLQSQQAELRSRQEAENALAKTNEELQAVIDAVPGFISWIGDDLHYRGVNRRLAEALGMTPETFVGQPLGFIDSAQEFETFIEQFIHDSHQETSQTILNVRLSNILKEYLIVAQKYHQGKSVVTVGIDITEWKDAERKLQVTNTQLKTLVNTLKGGVLLQDKNWNVILPNQGFCNIFQLNQTPQALIGKSKSALEQEYQDILLNPEEHFNNNQQLLERQISVNNQELKLRDGRTLEQDYAPIVLDGTCQGHLWMYRDITERKRHEQELQKSLQEKELLLKEVHHRVKNNLLVVSHLLELQEDYTDNQQVLSLLDQSRNRIHSMGLIHEKLYRTTGLNNINFAEYLEELVNSLWESYLEEDTAIELSLALEPVWLNLETANPCGLIVNELISNALQHAFPDETKGKVWVKLWTNPVDQQINLKIEDNGIGLPNQIDMNQLKSLGLELIFTLTEQIQGQLSIENKQGTSFHLCFPEVQYCPRY